MTTNTTALRLNCYAVNDDGHIECNREPYFRWNHTHAAVIRLIVGDTKSAKDFCNKVIAATDEPGACVGFGRTGAVMLFRIHETQAVETDNRRTAVHPFIFEGEQASLIATSIEQTIDVSEFQWRDNRSPLTVPRANLAPLFSDISKRAYDAVDGLLSAHAGRWGKLPTAAEIAADAETEKRRAKIAEEIAAGMYTPEKITEREDDELVTAWEGREVFYSDGVHAGQIIQARKRVAARKRLAAEAAAA